MSVIDERIFTIFNHYGEKHQLEKCLEEINELHDAITSEEEELLVDELADVYVMIHQLMINRWDAVVDRVEYKLNRQIERIKNEI